MKKGLLLIVALTAFVSLAGYALAQQGTMPGPGTMGPGGVQGGSGSGYYGMMGGMMGGQGQGYDMLGDTMSGMMGGMGQNGGAWMQGPTNDDSGDGGTTASPQRGFRRGYSPK